MRWALLIGAFIGTGAAAVLGARVQTSPPATAAPDPVKAPASPVDGEIVVTARKIPITRGGAWVFRRSDIILLRDGSPPVRLVPAASWAACMPTAQTDAMVRWLAQTGPYLTERETTQAVARLDQENIGGDNATTNDLLALLPSNLACYPPKRSTIDGRRVDVLQYCRQRKVGFNAQRRTFQMRLIGEHSNTEIAMRYSIDETTNTAGVGIGDPSEASSYTGLNRSSAGMISPQSTGSGASTNSVNAADQSTSIPGSGLRIRMAIDATWRTECGKQPAAPSATPAKP